MRKYEVGDLVMLARHFGKCYSVERYPEDGRYRPVRNGFMEIEHVVLKEGDLFVVYGFDELNSEVLKVTRLISSTHHWVHMNYLKRVNNG